MEALRRVAVGLGMTTFILSGIALFVFELYWFNIWWGGFGVFVGVFLAPAAALFPFIYLALEGFSPFYFGLWGLGFAGGLLAGALSD